MLLGSFYFVLGRSLSVYFYTVFASAWTFPIDNMLHSVELDWTLPFYGRSIPPLSIINKASQSSPSTLSNSRA